MLRRMSLLLGPEETSPAARVETQVWRGSCGRHQPIRWIHRGQHLRYPDWRGIVSDEGPPTDQGARRTGGRARRAGNCPACVKEDARFARLPGFGEQATTSRLSMPNALERAGRSQSFAQVEPHEA